MVCVNDFVTTQVLWNYENSYINVEGRANDEIEIARAKLAERTREW